MRQKRRADSNVGLADESGRRSGAAIESGYSQKRKWSHINRNYLRSFDTFFFLVACFFLAGRFSHSAVRAS